MKKETFSVCASASTRSKGEGTRCVVNYAHIDNDQDLMINLTVGNAKGYNIMVWIDPKELMKASQAATLAYFEELENRNDALEKKIDTLS